MGRRTLQRWKLRWLMATWIESASCSREGRIQISKPTGLAQHCILHVAIPSLGGISPSRQCVSSANPPVEFLLDWPGVNVNAEGGEYGTALQAAVSAGDRLSVEQLLRRGANVNLRGGKYDSALNAAIIKGYWYLVEVLLAAGALPDCKLLPNPDEEWLARICEEDGPVAVERYRMFWEKQKEQGVTAE